MSDSSRSPLSLRVGLGTDLHRLVAGRPLWVGGVQIDSELGADAHSDGDVALHALSDALLGAVAAGDIGELFPDTDPAHRDMDSTAIVQAALEQVAARGYRVGNVDLVVDLQRPKLSPHKLAIRQRVAELLEVGVDQVSFKAKTGEGVDAVGEGRAIAAQAVVLLLAQGAF